MTDDEFVRAFESCGLSPDLFHHRDHIRLARIYVDRYGVELDGAQKATERFRSSLRKFAEHIGKSEKYHETITVAWMRLVVHDDKPRRTGRTHGQEVHREVLFARIARDGRRSTDICGTRSGEVAG